MGSSKHPAPTLKPLGGGGGAKDPASPGQPFPTGAVQCFRILTLHIRPGNQRWDPALSFFICKLGITEATSQDCPKNRGGEAWTLFSRVPGIGSVRNSAHSAITTKLPWPLLLPASVPAPCSIEVLEGRVLFTQVYLMSLEAFEYTLPSISMVPHPHPWIQPNH